MFSRQGLPAIKRSQEQLANIQRGAYIISDCDGTPELILMASGSELQLALNAATELSQKGTKVRVVSMPSTTTFDAQDAEYRQQVLPAEVSARIAIEASHQDYWYKYVGFDGRVIGMNSFGESAPGGVLMEHFGFTVENVVATASDLLDA